MSVSRTSRLATVAPCIGGAAAFLLMLAIPARTQPGAANENWTSYGGGTANTRYSPLSQIDASNFSKLQVAWIFSTANLGPMPETNLESTPLVIDGVLYSTAGDRRDVVALNAATGELLWTHREDEANVLRFRPGVSPAAASRTGRMANDGASSTSPRAIA